MTAVKKTPPPAPRVTIEPFTGGSIARYEWKTFRFLLSDGSTFDVQAIRDDSDLRGAVLEHTGASKIEGVATVVESVPALQPARRRMVKRAD